MWGIVRAFFPPPLKVGDVLKFDDPASDGNPFAKDKPHRVVVLGVRRGWVNYRWENTNDVGLQNESMNRRSFAFCYKRDSDA